MSQNIDANDSSRVLSDTSSSYHPTNINSFKDSEVSPNRLVALRTKSKSKSKSRRSSSSVSFASQVPVEISQSSQVPQSQPPSSIFNTSQVPSTNYSSLQPSSNIFINSESGPTYRSCGSDPEVLNKSTSHTGTNSSDLSPHDENLLKEVVAFDYEVLVEEGVDVEQALIWLEERMLTYVSDVLLDCERRRRASTMTHTVFMDGSALSVTGLDSKPVDIIDYASCVRLITPDVGTCISVKGFMTAISCPLCFSAKAVKAHPSSLNKVDYSTTKMAILQAVKEGMMIGNFTSSDILQVSYIGQRVREDETPNLSAINESSMEYRSLQITSVGGALIAIFVLLVISLVISYRRRRATLSNYEEEDQKDKTVDWERDLDPVPNRDPENVLDGYLGPATDMDIVNVFSHESMNGSNSNGIEMTLDRCPAAQVF